MNDGIRASLLLFALLCSLGVVPVLTRSMRPGTLLAVHGVGMCVAFGAAVFEVTGRAASSSLALPYIAMLGLVLADRHEKRASTWMRFLASAVAVLGLMLAVSVQLFPTWGLAAQALASMTALAFSMTVSAILLRRAQQTNVEARRRAYRASSVMLLLAGVFVFLSSFDGFRALWPLGIGAAGGVVTSVRAPPGVVPTTRELTMAVLLGVAVFFVSVATFGVGTGALLGVGAILFDVGLVGLSRPLLEAATLLVRAPRSTGVERMPSPEEFLPRRALASLAPMVNDATDGAETRTAVTMRVPARRLFDAALETARERHRHLGADALVVDVHAHDADVDIEGDPALLTEALTATLSMALDRREHQPEVRVSAHLRGGFKNVTFEISDVHPSTTDGEVSARDPDHPFAARDGGRANLALARARVVVENHRGTLDVRNTSSGSVVQITVPRRRTRTVAGHA